MKLLPLVVAVAAAFSLSAVAAGDQKQKQEPQAQSGQKGAQTQASSQSPELVKQAQQKLSAAGHDAGAADGIAGPKTQAAVKEFQQSKGLQTSGQLDQKTLAALGVSGGASASASTSSEKSGSASAGASGEKSGSASAGSSTSEPKPQGRPPAAGGKSSEQPKPK